MIQFDQALEIVLQNARALPTEQVSIDDSLGRVLACDVTSDMDMPPFDKSAMDGYACRREDLTDLLTVIEIIPAGHAPTKTVKPHQCAKIMTGAVVPQGADCVIMVEYVEQNADDTVKFVGEKTADNICKKGEDIKAGEMVLKKGTVIGPPHIAVLASVGCANPLVAKKPRVAVIATGSELVSPECKPSPSQIRNSNSFQLTAQLGKAGVIPVNYGVVADTEEAIDNTFQKAAAENDVVLLSGGVSMGDYDLVPGILRQNKVELLFEKIAIKPGKPTVFGISKDTFCFGMPGNPVSTFVLFEILVKPFLYKMMGCDYKPTTVPVILERSVSRKKIDRDSWLPVTFTPEGKALAADYHGSAHINALCQAEGLICLPAGTAILEGGTAVAVRQI